MNIVGIIKNNLKLQNKCLTFFINFKSSFFPFDFLLSSLGNLREKLFHQFRLLSLYSQYNESLSSSYYTIAGLSSFSVLSSLFFLFGHLSSLLFFLFGHLSFFCASHSQFIIKSLTDIFIKTRNSQKVNNSHRYNWHNVIYAINSFINM